MSYSARLRKSVFRVLSLGAAHRARAMKGVECRHSKQLIDELPMAYKHIDEVMENPNVAIDHTLKQVVNVKGD